MKLNIVYFFLSGFLCLIAGRYSYSANLSLDYSVKFQTIEGFGGGFVFNIYPYRFQHPKKDELYDSIFNNAGINILRICNWYNPQADSEVMDVPMLLEIQKKWPDVKVMLASWSPPPYLKNNNGLLGAARNDADQLDTFTLKKNDDSTFMYDEYGEYWLKSVNYFRSKGVRIDWVSIQNEPNFPAEHEGCMFLATESPTMPSYGKALNAVYSTFQAGMVTPPLLIGPDVTGVGNDLMYYYLKSPDLVTAQLSAYCHHHYDVSTLYWYTKTGNDFHDKPIYQTEYLVNDGVADYAGLRTWFDHARIIHNTLTEENAAMYNVFALTYKPLSTHCFFSIDTLGGDWFMTRQTYYMFKHYSKSIRRGWQRLAAITDDTTLLASAYSNANNDSTAVVIINNGATPQNITLSAPGKTGEVHQTTDSLKYVSLGYVSNTCSIDLPCRSITTIDLHTGSDTMHISKRHYRASLPRIEAVTMDYRGTTVIDCCELSTPTVVSIFDLTGNLKARQTLHPSISGRNRWCLEHPLGHGSFLIRLACEKKVAVQKIIIAQ